MIDWITVFSSDIRKIGYDTSTSRMYIDFADSDPYCEYCGVPVNLYHQFVSASSVGDFYRRYIKDQYEC